MRKHPDLTQLAVDGLLRVCAWCQRVQGRHGRWVTVALTPQAVEGTKVSHGICSRCRDTHRTGAPPGP